MRSYFKRTMNLEGLTKISTGCFELNMLWGQAFRGSQGRGNILILNCANDAVCLRQLDHAELVGMY